MRLPEDVQCPSENVDKKEGGKKMQKKVVVLVIAVMVCGLVGLSGCAGKGKQEEKKEKATVSVEASTVSPQEMKTYVSKYGFSVSYPADWCLEENKGSEMPRYRRGLLAFDLYDPNNQEVGMFVKTQPDEKGSPKEIKDKLIYLGEKQNAVMRTTEKVSIIKKDGILMGIAFGSPRGVTAKYYVLYFYLSKSGEVAIVSFDAQEEDKVLEILNKIRIKIH